MINYSVEDYWFSSPGYLRCKLPQEVVDELRQTLDGVSDGSIPEIDNRPFGRQHLTSELKLPVTPKIKYLVESMCYDYDNIFRGGDPLYAEYFHVDDRDKIEYDFKSMWATYSYKGDFNPVHRHEGMFAFVIWVKIPYSLEDELSSFNGKGKLASQFSFQKLNPVGEIKTDALYIDKSWEWNIILFHAFLYHSVMPFYTSDEVRISIAGDVYAKMKEWA